MTGPSRHRLLITSGDGPRECRRAVSLALARMAQEANRMDLAFAVDLPEGAEEDASASALVTLSGDQASALIRRWAGSIQWTATSPYRPHHKRRNWYVGVFPLEAGDGPSSEIDPRDLRFETFRAGGPGGQHQNTTDSGVRLTHLPSGVSVVAKEERSQHRNKQAALERLAARLFFAEQAKAAHRKSAENLLHKRLERGNPVRSFQGPDFRER